MNIIQSFQKKFNLLVNEEPSSCVHEDSTVCFRLVSGSSSDQSVYFHLTWRKQVNSWNALVTNCHLTLDGAYVETLETAAVFKDGPVWSSHSEFYSCKFWHDSEEAHLSSDHLHAINTKWLWQHLIFYYNWVAPNVDALISTLKILKNIIFNN